MAVTERLSNINQLLLQGQLYTALHELEKLEKEVENDNNEINKLKLVKSSIYIKLGDFEGANELASQALKASERYNSKMQMIDALISIAESSWRLGRYNESYETVEKGEKLLNTLTQNQDKSQREALLLYHKAYILFLKGKIYDALEIGNRGLDLQKEIGNETHIAEFLRLFGTIYWNKGELDQALDHYRQSFIIFEKTRDKIGIGTSLNNIGSIFHMRGKLDLALEYKQNAARLLEEIGDKKNFAFTLQQISEVYSSKGELSQAFDYAQRSLAIFEELGNKHSIAENLYVIGELFKTKGDLDAALEFYKKSLDLYKKVGRLGALPLASMGEIYHLREEFGLALENYRKSLDYFEEIGFDLIETRTLYYNLIQLCIDTKAYKEAEYYIQHLQKINEKEENIVLNQLCRLSQAMLLKTSKRITNIAEAQKIFLQVAGEEIVFFDLTIDAILNLCELLLAELQSFGNEEVLSELKTWSSKLLELAQTQHSISLLAETYLLKSKLSLLELDTERAQNLLNQAKELAEENDLQQLLTKILDEQFLLHEQLSRWESLQNQKLSIKERINLIQLEDLLDRMIHKRFYQKQEEIIEYAAEAQQLVEKWEKE